MTALLRGELIKSTRTRSLAGFAGLAVGWAALNVIVVALASGTLRSVDEKAEALSALPMVLMLLGVVGAAGEYRHRTAAPTALVAGTGRGVLLLARTAAYTLVGLSVSVLMVGVSLALGLPALSDQPGEQLDLGEVAAVTGGNLLALILSVILGVAIGGLVRNQVVGVVTVLLANFVLNPLLAGISETLANLTPFGAASVLTRMTHDTTLSVGGGALVLTGWTIVLLMAAVLVERRRDVA